VAEDAEGVWTTKIVSMVFEDYQDTHAKNCKMN
jgi:hypothetical protein